MGTGGLFLGQAPRRKRKQEGILIVGSLNPEGNMIAINPDIWGNLVKTMPHITGKTTVWSWSL